MKKRMILTGLLLFAVFGGLLAYNLTKRQLRKLYLSHYTPPPITVSATLSQAEVWQPTLPAVGTLTAVQGVNVTTQVPGKVTKILFEDGQKVKHGDLLVVLEDSVQKAELENASAARDLAATAIKRFRPLLAKGAISPYHMDKLNAEYKEANAQVAQAQANLDYVHIKAPFSGRLGIRQVDLGQYVQSGTDIVTLATEGTLFADFTLPEKDLTKVFVGQEVSLTTDALKGRTFKGKVTAVSPEVDQSTRNFSVRATLPNEDNTLYPGLFARVEVHLPQDQNVVTVPKTAVSYTLYGDTVFVLDQDTREKYQDKPIMTVKRLPVQPGMEREDQVAILSGLQPNQKVVTSGQLKLQNGSRVVVKEDKLVPPETMPLQ